jgi:hypothetical protein
MEGMPSRKPPQTASEIAGAILQLYRDDPTRWTQEEYAETSQKVTVEFDSRRARCWCVMGACYRVTKHSMEAWGESPAILSFRDQIKKITGRHALDFNDAPETKFRDVVATLRKIAKPKNSTRAVRS